MPAVMFQGTGSNVGKSILVAGICRILLRRGLNVAPFKPQNMSNNAAVTVNGGEIGRAQALQALACGLDPHTDMNPILLKPETETGSQVIVQGKIHSRINASEYSILKQTLMKPVLESFKRLSKANDLILVEGAGSPAEVNLRRHDIANMGFATVANVPVVLVGDIDRGGVIAQIVGTHAVLPANDKKRIVGFIVNKFRGDSSLFDKGYQTIINQTGWPAFGILPYFVDAWRLPAEDAQDIISTNQAGNLKIVCLCLSRMANFDDLDPLAQEEGVELVMLKAGRPIPGDAKLVIIPGSKSTRGDLLFIKQQRWDIDLHAHYRRGGHILGICGGFQMLGESILDPEGLDGPAGETNGLGFLKVITRMEAKKTMRKVQACHFSSGLDVKGYEIHLGKTSGIDCQRPFAKVDYKPEGARSQDDRVQGTYLHGLFHADDFRRLYLKGLGAPESHFMYEETINKVLDQLADHIEKNLDVDSILAFAS